MDDRILERTIRSRINQGASVIRLMREEHKTKTPETLGFRGSGAEAGI